MTLSESGTDTEAQPCRHRCQTFPVGREGEGEGGVNLDPSAKQRDVKKPYTQTWF